MGQGSGWWIVDWPAADNHFTSGLQRLTRIDVGDPRHLSLTDSKLFDYPWIYATQTGWWGLSPTEIARLREYLLRGGYLMTDDFWSIDPAQWQVFAGTMAQVLPGQAITDLELSDPVRHVLYDIEEQDLTWIPGSRHLRQFADGTDPTGAARGHAAGVEIDGGRPRPHRGRRELQHRHRRCLGIRRRAVLSREDDRARLPLRRQLRGLRDDALKEVVSYQLVSCQLKAFGRIGA